MLYPTVTHPSTADFHNATSVYFAGTVSRRLKPDWPTPDIFSPMPLPRGEGDSVGGK